MKNKIDSFMEQMVKCRRIPGAMLAVVNGDATYATGYGVVDVDSGRKVDKETLFNIGSISKMFTSAILVDIMQRNKKSLNGNTVTWDSKLADLLGPDYALNDGLDGLSLSTLRDIVSHRTGIATADLGIYAGYHDNLTREEFSKRLRLLPAKYSFRDQFLYSNVLSTLAGHVAEKLTGQQWEDLLEERLWQPLGMTSSTVLDQAFFLKNNIAAPHIFNVTTHRLEVQDHSIYRIHPLEPSGALCSNAEDLVKWLRHLLGVYRFDPIFTTPSGPRFLEMFRDQVLLKATRREYRKVHPPVFPVDDVQVAYCLSLMTRYYNGIKVFFHGGDFYAYSSMLWLVPGINTGFVISINGPGQTFETITAMLYYLTELFRGYGSWINTTTACSFPLPWEAQVVRMKPLPPKKPVNTPLTKPASTYTGVYGNGVVGNLFIEETSDGKGLFCKLGVQLRGRLRPDEELPNDGMALEIEGPMTMVKDLDVGIYLEFLQQNQDGKYDLVVAHWHIEDHNFTRDALFDDALTDHSRRLALKSSDTCSSRSWNSGPRISVAAITLTAWLVASS
ncbi:uncharacterized protein LOC121375675 [Gigantopelta aegis]|uniref:uncharacterized protein LOC121375675 n=1 Tax=Gigantopelta aegis TaxID=1735272 RepID=UPI001B88B068|nr:uncharacterized protein LOC121375675 [Gigantopelta aegis]